MFDPVEEQRAQEYRRSLAAREASQARRLRLLAGSASAGRTLWTRWRPWTDPQPSVAEAPDSDLVN